MTEVGLSDPGIATLARHYGGHSMIAPLRTVMVRPPTPVADPEAWRGFGYPRPADTDHATREHTALTDLIRSEGIDVVVDDQEAPGLLDAIFPYDPSIMTDKGTIICRMGKELRRPESDRVERLYERLGIPVLGRIEAPGMVEGGDTMWLDEHTLLVGRGYRTNSAGIAQLQALFDAANLNVEVRSVALPHWTGPGDCLHLLSLISPVADGLAIAYPKLMSVGFVELLRSRGWRLLEIPDEEFATQGCNVLTLAPGVCVTLLPNEVSRAKLAAEGCRVLTYQGDEISHNRAGGPTCLTRPIWREG